jgi:tripartite-type tricarboxylate transporter receptor subunit TctC
MESNDVKNFFASQGFQVSGSTPPEIQAFVTSEVARWADIVKAGNVRPE